MGGKETLWTRDFSIITIGTAISALGGAAMNVALGLVVFDSTDSAWMTGVFMALSMLPSVVLPVLFSPYMDTHSRKRIIVLLDAVMGVLYLGFAVYTLGFGFRYGAYVLFGLLTGSIGAVYSTAYNAFYPDTIPPAFLQKGYSVSSLLYPTATVVAAPLAAVLYSQAGIHTLFFAEGVMLLVASLFESQLRVREIQAQGQRARFSLKAYRQELASGFRYLRQEKGIRSLYGYMAVTNAAGNGVNLLVMTYFQTSPVLTTALYSLLISAETLGRMAGGVIHYFAKIPPARRYPIANTVYQVYSVLDGCLLFLPYPGMLINRFLAGFLGVNSATLREAAIQRRLPVHMRARVNSLFSVAVMGGVMLFQLLSGALGEVFPYRAVVVGLSALSLGCVYLLVVRNRRFIAPLFEADNAPGEAIAPAQAEG